MKEGVGKVSVSKPALVRTDFTSDSIWREVVAAVTTPSKEGFLASLSIVDDHSFNGTSAEQIAATVPSIQDHAVLFIVDRMTIVHRDRPVFCIDLPMSGRSFRAIPATLWSIENNLSLANMDFEEFGEAVDTDGIFRGFE